MNGLIFGGASSPAAEVFSASIDGTPAANITGDWTVFDVPYDTEDVGASWASLNTSTGKVTFSESGVFMIVASVVLGGGSDADAAQIRAYIDSTAHDFADFPSPNSATFFPRLVTLAAIEAGQVLTIAAAAGGGSKAYEIQNGNSAQLLENALHIAKI